MRGQIQESVSNAFTRKRWGLGGKCPGKKCLELFVDAKISFSGLTLHSLVETVTIRGSINARTVTFTEKMLMDKLI